MIADISGTLLFLGTTEVEKLSTNLSHSKFTASWGQTPK